jgi:hypothetical protein
MATRKITKRIVDDEIECAAERETARQTPSLVTSLMLRSSNEHPDSEELELAETGLVRLPTGCKPAGFILGMPAPRVSFEEAVSAVTSERDEG